MDAPEPPVRHPVPIPWSRWARFWAGPCLALVGLGGWVVWNFSQPLSGRNHYETSAISTLRNVASCQSQFQEAAGVDEDGDGIGEFGGFLEMSGKVAPRGRASPIRPPVLSGAFRTLQTDGTVSRSGYHFRMFLVGKDGTALGEVQRIGFDEGEIDPDVSESRWVCYAWPQRYEPGLTRTFVVSETGDILATDCAAYAGAAGPRPGAALLPVAPPPTAGGTAGSCCSPPDPLDFYDSPLADGVPARDGNVWRQVN